MFGEVGGLGERSRWGNRRSATVGGRDKRNERLPLAIGAFEWFLAVVDPLMNGQRTHNRK